MKTRSGKRVRTKRPIRKPNRRKASRPSGNRARIFSQYVFPLVISGVLVICLTAIGYLGYQRASASSFFSVKRIDVFGTHRSSRDAIEGVVRSESERPGVWRSDLFEIKSKIEKLPYVKSATVTRVLPNGLRVQVAERIPVALVLRGGTEYFVDSEGTVLGVGERSPELPFVMIGWDENKTEKAYKENIERTKFYQKMLSEWRAANLVSRVQQVNMVDPRDPRAVISDSNQAVSVAVGRENFGDNLSRGIKAIVGKGEMFQGVDLVGANLVLEPRTKK